MRPDLPDPHLWAPEAQNLYRLAVTTDTDRVESYFALRTVTVREGSGYMRLCLNGKPVFPHGVLDQGYFRDKSPHFTEKRKAGGWERFSHHPKTTSRLYP